MKYLYALAALSCITLMACSEGHYMQVNAIHHSVHERFTYYSTGPDFPPKSVPDGNFTGNCNDFAVGARTELEKAGITGSRIVFCTVYGKPHHALYYDGYILDNRNRHATELRMLHGYDCRIGGDS